MTFREKIRQGREEASRAQLWRAESWTPLLHYIHVKAFSIGVGIGFTLGVAFATVVVLIGRLG